MVGIPESFEIRPANLFPRVPYHDAQCCGHNPASYTGTGSKVGEQEGDDSAASIGGRDHSQMTKVPHVGRNMDDRPDDDGPSSRLVECDILVEWNYVVERGSTEE